MGLRREEAVGPVKAEEDRGAWPEMRPHLTDNGTRQALCSRGSLSSSPNEELNRGSWILEFHRPIKYQKPNRGNHMDHQLFIPLS